MTPRFNTARPTRCRFGRKAAAISVSSPERRATEPHSVITSLDLFYVEVRANKGAELPLLGKPGHERAIWAAIRHASLRRSRGAQRSSDRLAANARAWAGGRRIRHLGDVRRRAARRSALPRLELRRVLEGAPSNAPKPTGAPAVSPSSPATRSSSFRSRIEQNSTAFRSRNEQTSTAFRSRIEPASGARHSRPLSNRSPSADRRRVDAVVAGHDATALDAGHAAVGLDHLEVHAAVLLPRHRIAPVVERAILAVALRHDA